MLEVYVLVEKKQNLLLKICEMVLWIVAVLSMILTVMGASLFLLVMTISMLLAYFLHTRNFEFEYSYFDGEVRFAKITNKSSRKRLGVYDMEEVLNIAPIEDRSMYNYLNDSHIKVLDYTSRKNDVKIYGMVVKGAEGLKLIKFEPDEKYLDAVCVKYRQKVIR